MLDLGRNKNVEKGSIQTSKGVMCEFEAEGWLVEVTVLVKVEAET
jgi:hypothetical protein